MTIQKVLLAGAAGALGEHILPALLAAGFSVTALVRAGSASNSKLPPNVTLATSSADFAVDELIPLVRDHDAVVSALGFPALISGAQTRLAEAVKRAGGVRLFVLSEFGSDPSQRWWHLVPAVFGMKHKLREAVAAQASAVPWAGIANGAFFEWGLDRSFLHIDVPARKAMVLDDGERKFPATRMGTIGRAVACVLQHHEQVANRVVHVQSFAVSQMDVVRALEKELGVKFEVERRPSADWIAEYEPKAAAGDMEAIYAMVLAQALTEERFEGTEKGLDNDLIGLPQDSFDVAVKEYCEKLVGSRVDH